MYICTTLDKLESWPVEVTMAVFGQFAPEDVRLLVSYTRGPTHYKLTQVKHVMLAPNNFAALSLQEASGNDSIRYFDIEAYFTKYCATIDGQDFVLVVLADPAETHMLFSATTLPTSEEWLPHTISKFKAMECRSPTLPTPAMDHFRAHKNVVAIIRYYLSLIGEINAI